MLKNTMNKIVDIEGWKFYAVLYSITTTIGVITFLIASLIMQLFLN